MKITVKTVYPPFEHDISYSVSNLGVRTETFDRELVGSDGNRRLRRENWKIVYPDIVTIA